jgi:Tol biopolymer transport system component
MAAAQESGTDEVSVRRVWSGEEVDFYAAHPSPNGRYVTDIHWMSGDLAVNDLVSGEVVRVGAKARGWGEMSWAESSVFSPDGGRIAYTWFSGKLGVDAGYSVRTILMPGGEPETLVPVGEADYYYLDEWSSDGEYILARMFRPTSADVGTGAVLVRIRVSDGRIERIVDDLPGEGPLRRGPTKAGFSPGGQFVAFDSERETGSHDLFVVSAAGGDPVPILEGHANDRLMGWLPDGSAVLFYSDRGATSGIWSLPLDRDLNPGEPRLLKADVWRATPLGFSRDAYYYGVATESRQVYTGAIDVANGGYRAPLGPVQEVSGWRTHSGEFSPDGHYLAYAVRLPGRRHNIVVRAVGGDEERTFESDRERKPVGWTSDSRGVLLFTVDPDAEEGNSWRIERLDLATGKTTEIAPGVGSSVIVSPDGTLGYGVADPETQTTIVEFDLRDGSMREVIKTGRSRGLSLSPDGKTLAVIDVKSGGKLARLSTVPVSGGELNVLYETGFGMKSGLRTEAQWTPDGRHLVFVEDQSIYRLAVAGGSPQKVVDLPVTGFFGNFRLHPDGSRFVLEAGVDKGEIWMVRGLPGMPSGTSGSD